jgi:hypothetical protein
MIRVGDTVKLRARVPRNTNIPEGRQDFRTAKVIAFLDTPYIGGVRVDRDLNGMVFWNVQDLEKAK